MTRKERLFGAICDLLGSRTELMPDDAHTLAWDINGLIWAAIGDGEADYRAFLDRTRAEFGDADGLPLILRMLREFGPDALPASADGKVHFARCLLDAAADAIKGHLRIDGERRKALVAAVHALRSYEHHNASPDLAKGVAGCCQQMLDQWPKP